MKAHALDNDRHETDAHRDARWRLAARIETYGVAVLWGAVTALLIVLDYGLMQAGTAASSWMR